MAKNPDVARLWYKLLSNSGCSVEGTYHDVSVAQYEAMIRALEKPLTAEQQLRNALEAMGFPDAQSLSAGECMSAAIAAMEIKAPSDPPADIRWVIERRDGWWCASSAQVPGALLAHTDLTKVLADIPRVWRRLYATRSVQVPPPPPETQP